jgi:uncharacterized protein YecE (DUF72 family)
LFGSAPSTLRFAFKVPEEITVKIYPPHARYGVHAGHNNEFFLNANRFSEMFCQPLMPFREQIAVLIFEFGGFGRAAYEDPCEFIPDLDAFLTAIPRDMRCAVEVRNSELLCRAYLDCLRRHGVAHVFNAWSRMPELDDQMAVEGVQTAGFTVARALLRHGCVYEQAVDQFAPYREVRDPNSRGREAIKGLIKRARSRKEPSYIFVNNRFEGNAPSTIEAITE